MNGMTAQRQATSIKLLEGAVVRHHSEEWIRKAERNKEMYRVKRIVVLLLSFLLLAACPGKAEDDVFIRIDRDDPNAWKEELANVRFLQEEGMSGSAQFSEKQFRDLAVQLSPKADR